MGNVCVCWRSLSSVREQLEMNAARFVVLVMFDVTHPQLTPDLRQ